MHELQFADAVQPDTCAVLKLGLRPFSIGHEILLFSRRNALLLENFDSLPAHLKRAALIQAVNVCSQTYAQNLFVPSSWGERRRSRKVWAKWDRALRSVDWEVETRKFQDYLRAGSKGPPVERGEQSNGRDPGAPFHAGLIQFLIEALRLTEAECFDYPLSLAKFHYYAAAEATGAVRIINAAEYEFEESCRLKDLEAARKAGFATTEEHISHLKSKISNSKPAAGKGVAAATPYQNPS
jgi:hypothetical protein